MVTNEDRIVALAKFLETSAEDIEVSYDEGHLLEIGLKEYCVLTDEEADAMVRERILDDLWAFRPAFLLDHLRITTENRHKVENSLRKVQGNLCEDATPLIRAMLEDEDKFVEDAVNADGRGHFLSSYDGREEEVEFNGTDFYIYRHN